jgi:hypothetical protein
MHVSAGTRVENTMDSSPSTRTDSDVLQSVVAAHRFTTEDIEANRKLQLSAFQQQSLKMQTRVFGITLLVSLAMILSVFAWRSVITYFLGAMGLILGAASGFLLYQVSVPRTVSVIEGVMSRRLSMYQSSEGGQRYSHFYRIGDVEFGVDRVEYDALEHNIPVRAYYLPGVNELLSLELLADQGTQAERQASTSLPPTDL